MAALVHTYARIAPWCLPSPSGQSHTSHQQADLLPMGTTLPSLRDNIPASGQLGPDCTEVMIPDNLLAKGQQELAALVSRYYGHMQVFIWLIICIYPVASSCNWFPVSMLIVAENEVHDKHTHTHIYICVPVRDNKVLLYCIVLYCIVLYCIVLYVYT